MSHISPGALLVWTLLTFWLLVFFVFHMWNFDRFQSLRWNSGSGTFKRVMVYTYSLTIPSIFCYVLGFTIIKYQQGYSEVLGFGDIPTPYILWSSTQEKAIFPLTLIFSIGWSLEMVTHLEELCFWLFLLNATSIERNWFHSPYFKTWIAGSLVAVLYMPLVTTFTRENPLKNEAYCFLAGGLGSLSITIWFLPILWSFPDFLNNLRSEGVDTATIVRLTKFSELNTIRIVFRFLFTVPIVILGIDGVRPHVHINQNLFATDFLVMISGIGCVISSAITLVIFFPRSIEGEIATRDARKMSRKGISTGFGGIETQAQMSSRDLNLPSDSNLIMSDSLKRDYTLTLSPEGLEGGGYHTVNGDHWSDERPENNPEPPFHALRPNRRKDSDVPLVSHRLTARNVSEHNLRAGNVNYMVSNFTSPIDIASYPNPKRGRLTFTR